MSGTGGGCETCGAVQGASHERDSWLQTTRKFGTVVRLDLDTHQLHLKSKEVVIPYTLAGDVRIVHDKEPARLDQLKAGMRINLVVLNEEVSLVTWHGQKDR